MIENMFGNHSCWNGGVQVSPPKLINSPPEHLVFFTALAVEPVAASTRPDPGNIILRPTERGSLDER